MDAICFLQRKFVFSLREKPGIIEISDFMMHGGSGVSERTAIRRQCGCLRLLAGDGVL